MGPHQSVSTPSLSSEKLPPKDPLQGETLFPSGCFKSVRFAIHLSALVGSASVGFWGLGKVLPNIDRDAQVVGGSMLPNLCDGDHVPYQKFGQVERFSIVIFPDPERPRDPSAYCIKRVIGMPGETISGKDGKILVNGKSLPHEPATFGPTLFVDSLTVPAGYVYVLGDNRTNSVDSRIVGCIPIKELKVVDPNYLPR